MPSFAASAFASSSVRAKRKRNGVSARLRAGSAGCALSKSLSSANRGNQRFAFTRSARRWSTSSAAYGRLERTRRALPSSARPSSVQTRPPSSSCGASPSVMLLAFGFASTPFGPNHHASSGLR